MERRLGKGGMGAVYLVRNTAGERAALKLVDLAGVTQADQRFEREMRLLADIDHPSISRFHGALAEPRGFLMEYVEGQSLAARISQGPLGVDESLRIVRELADVLTYLHVRDIRHRDLKPANVMLQSRGWLKLVDFGIAVQVGGTRHTEVGMLVGTLPYIPPEALELEESDSKDWDLYALGVILQECLTGHEAFDGGTGTTRVRQARILKAKLQTEHLDPGPDFPDDVRDLVRHLTHRDRALRLASAAEVTRAIQGLLGGAAPLAGDRPAVEPRVPTLADQPIPEVEHTVQVTAPPPPRGASRWVALVLLVGVLAAGLFAATQRAPTSTDVAVVFGGPGTSHTLLARWDGQTHAVANSSLGLPGVTPGSHRLEVLVGSACDSESCPGPQCSSCCAVVEQTLDVAAGVTTETVTLPAPVGVGPRPVSLVITQEPRLGRLTGAIQGVAEPQVDGSALLFAAVSPGLHSLRLEAGRCPASALGCATSETCPAGCASWIGDLDVPCGDGEHQEALLLRGTAASSRDRSAAKPSDDEPAPPAPKPEPDPTGTVRVQGDARIQLRGPGGTQGVGEVPVGTWQVRADFGGGYRDQGRIVVTEGATLTVACSTVTLTCKLPGGS